MISRKEFRRQYGAELLPASAANYSVGDIWDRVGLNDRLTPENENIAYVCDNDTLAHALEGIEKVQANFPDIDLSSDINADMGVDIPSLNISVADSLQVTKIEQMVIRGVSTKNALSGYRSKIYDAVEALKKANFQKYKRKIRHKEIVSALFYAEHVDIIIEKEVSNRAAFKADIESLFKVDAQVNFESDNKIHIQFANPDCPFAAQFEQGRDI